MGELRRVCMHNDYLMLTMINPISYHAIWLRRISVRFEMYKFVDMKASQKALGRMVHSSNVDYGNGGISKVMTVNCPLYYDA